MHSLRYIIGYLRKLVSVPQSQFQMDFLNSLNENADLASIPRLFHISAAREDYMKSLTSVRKRKFTTCILVRICCSVIIDLDRWKLLYFCMISDATTAGIKSLSIDFELTSNVMKPISNGSDIANCHARGHKCSLKQGKSRTIAGTKSGNI